MRTQLERVPVPDADAAQERARAVVLAAFAEREPAPRPRRGRSPPVAAALAALRPSASRSSRPPGQRRRRPGPRGRRRRALGTGALLAPGRRPAARDVLATECGSSRRTAKKRLLRRLPRGELVAVRPLRRRHTRRTSSRRSSPTATSAGRSRDRGVRSPRLDRHGDRHPDRLRRSHGHPHRRGRRDGRPAPRAAERGPLAWRPGERPRARLRLRERGARPGRRQRPRRLARPNRGPAERRRSSNGRRTDAVCSCSHPQGSRVYGAARTTRSRGTTRPTGRPTSTRPSEPGTHRVVVARVHGAQSTVFDLATGRTVFNGTGVFDGIAFSPDGRWLAIGWRDGRPVGLRPEPTRPRTIRAVSGIASQFRGAPRIEGWCCEELGSRACSRHGDRDPPRHRLDRRRSTTRCRFATCSPATGFALALLLPLRLVADVERTSCGFLRDRRTTSPPPASASYGDLARLAVVAARVRRVARSRRRRRDALRSASARPHAASACSASSTACRRPNRSVFLIRHGPVVAVVAPRATSLPDVEAIVAAAARLATLGREPEPERDEDEPRSPRRALGGRAGRRRTREARSTASA